MNLPVSHTQQAILASDSQHTINMGGFVHQRPGSLSSVRGLHRSFGRMAAVATVWLIGAANGSPVG